MITTDSRTYYIWITPQIETLFSFLDPF
jgi:hypothetical protein